MKNTIGCFTTVLFSLLAPLDGAKTAVGASGPGSSYDVIADGDSSGGAIAAGLPVEGKDAVQNPAYPAQRDSLEAARQIVRPKACKQSVGPKTPPPEKP